MSQQPTELTPARQKQLEFSRHLYALPFDMFVKILTLTHLSFRELRQIAVARPENNKTFWSLYVSEKIASYSLDQKTKQKIAGDIHKIMHEKFDFSKSSFKFFDNKSEAHKRLFLLDTVFRVTLWKTVLSCRFDEAKVMLYLWGKYRLKATITQDDKKFGRFLDTGKLLYLTVERCNVQGVKFLFQ